jgi:hypothetical protein
MLYEPIKESYKQFWKKILLVVKYIYPEKKRKEIYEIALFFVQRYD